MILYFFECKVSNETAYDNYMLATGERRVRLHFSDDESLDEIATFCPRKRFNLTVDALITRHHAKATNEAEMKFYSVPDQSLKFTGRPCAVGNLRQLMNRRSDFTTRSAEMNFFRRAAALLADASLMICKRYGDSFTWNMNCHYDRLLFYHLRPHAAAENIGGKRAVKEKKKERETEREGRGEDSQLNLSYYLRSYLYCNLF